MKTATAVLLALAFMTLGLAVAPSAAAAERCVVGDDPDDCAASVQFIYCVTTPCDPVKVCVAYGTLCI